MTESIAAPDPALERAGKTMRSRLRAADAARGEGRIADAHALWDSVVDETPPALRHERWYDSALGMGPRFAAMLADYPDPTRIYIAGCGRSGTWFALGIASAFGDSRITPEERHFGHFAAIRAEPAAVHIVKRNHDAHRFLAEIPGAIDIVYMLRDPRDVLTSRHLARANYVSPERWHAEMDGLEAALATGRGNFHVVRFEDLARDANAVQRRLADAIGLDIARPADRFCEGFVADAGTRAIMNELRPPDPSVIGRWRNDPAQAAHVAGIWPAIRDRFAPIAARFGYDEAGAV